MRGLGKFIGGIKFGVSMDTRKLQKDIKSARKRIANFVRSVKNTTLAIGGLSGAIGAVGLAAFTKEAFTAIDSLAKTSDKLGLTTEALAGLRLAAEESGVASNTLDMALQRMVRRVAEAANGTGEAKDALKQLNLNAQELAKLSPDQQFLEIADAMKKVRSNGEQVRLAFKLFDSEGVSLVNTLRQGSESLRQYEGDAVALGLAVSRESARGVERAIDSFNRFKASLFGIFTSIAVEIAPVIEALTGKLTKFLVAGAKGKSIGSFVGKAITEMAKFVADGAQKAFAAMLRFAASGLDLINQLRSSKVAGKLGLSVPSVADFQVPQRLRNRAAFLEADRNLPSKFIEKLVAANTQAIAKETNKTSGFAFKAAKNVLDRLVGSTANNVRGLGQIGSGVANLPFVKMLPQILGNLAQGARSVTQRGSLSFAQAGSAESYRQRARIRNQRDTMKLDKTRNGLLKNIEKKLENPVVLLAANVG